MLDSAPPRSGVRTPPCPHHRRSVYPPRGATTGEPIPCRVLDDPRHEVPHRPIQFRLRQTDRRRYDIGMQLGKALLQAGLHVRQRLDFAARSIDALLPRHHRGRNSRSHRFIPFRGLDVCHRSGVDRYGSRLRARDTLRGVKRSSREGPPNGQWRPAYVVRRVAGPQDPAVTGRYLHPNSEALIEAGTAFSTWWAQTGPTDETAPAASVSRSRHENGA